MKHTTTRKKMLLSSVAMLLVAMMALGSATFAWFTTNPTVSASGVKMQVNTSTGLKTRSESQVAILTKENAPWSKTAVLNAAAPNATATKETAFSVDPVSGDAALFFTTTALKDDAYGKDPDAKVSAVTPYAFSTGGIGSTGSYYSEKVYVKPEGGPDSAAVSLSNVSITWGNNTISKAARVAILNQAGATVAVFAPTSHGNATKTYVTGDDNSTEKKTSTYTDTVYKTIGTNNGSVASLDTEIALGDFGKGGDDAYTVIAYLDGEDSNCYTDNATTLQNLVSNISLTVSADLATAA